MRLLVAGLLVLSLGSVRAQDIPVPEWFAESLLDLREDVAEAAGEGKRVMLYFGQSGCPACEKLVRHTFGDPKIKTKARKHFLPLAINVWGDREVTWTDGKKLSEKQLAAMLKVQATPGVFFLDEKGAIVQRLTGFLPPAQFGHKLDAALGKGLPAAYGEPARQAGGSAAISGASSAAGSGRLK